MTTRAKDIVRAIVFDFDNTIMLDEHAGTGSEEIKVSVWGDVFPELDRNNLHAILSDVQQSISGGQGDRTQIARVLCRHVGFDGDQLELESTKRVEAFCKRLQDEMLTMGVTQGVREALRTLSGGYRLYVNSATPQDALESILSELDLREYFVGVYGRPNTKEENLSTILAQEGVTPDRILIVDDQPIMHAVARRLGYLFVGVKTKAVPRWDTGEEKLTLISSVAELSTFLRNKHNT